MPYGIRMQNGRHCVYKTETGETVPSGCYDSHDKALARQRALTVNVDDSSRYEEMSEDVKQELKEWREGHTE